MESMFVVLSELTLIMQQVAGRPWSCRRLSFLVPKGKIGPESLDNRVDTDQLQCKVAGTTIPLINAMLLAKLLAQTHPMRL